MFEEPEVRLKKGLTAAVITADLRKRLTAIQGAFIIVIPPPPVPGIGTGGGFTMRIQDRQGRGAELLAAANDELVAAASENRIVAEHDSGGAVFDGNIGGGFRDEQYADTRRCDERGKFDPAPVTLEIQVGVI